MPGLCSEYDPLIQVFLGSPHVPATVFWKGLFLVNGHLTMRFTELLCGHSDLDVGSYSLLRFPNCVQHGSKQARHVDVVRVVIEFVKG
jgi:hypothetical protein